MPQGRSGTDQVRLIREAFAAAGIDEQADRLVQAAAARPVSSLRELLETDLRSVLDMIDRRAHRAEPAGGTAWDQRDSDTWIDRL